MKFGLKRTSVGRRVWTRQGRATCEWISPENPLRSRDAGVKPGGLSRGASAVRTCFLNPAPSSRADIPTHVLWLCAERVPAAGGIIPPSPPAEVSQTLQLTLGPVQPRRVGSLGCNVAPRSDPPFLCASGSSQAVLQPNPREGAGGGPYRPEHRWGTVAQPGGPARHLHRGNGHWLRDFPTDRRHSVGVRVRLWRPREKGREHGLTVRVDSDSLLPAPFRDPWQGQRAEGPVGPRARSQGVLRSGELGAPS